MSESKMFYRRLNYKNIIYKSETLNKFYYVEGPNVTFFHKLYYLFYFIL